MRTAWVREALERVDKAAAASAATMGPPACRRGCSWCCSSVFTVTAAEAVHVATYIRREKSARVRADILRRLEDVAAWMEGKTTAELLKSRRPCAFLHEGACTVYAARPALCRGYLSDTPEACERLATDPGAATMERTGPLAFVGEILQWLASDGGGFVWPAPAVLALLRGHREAFDASAVDATEVPTDTETKFEFRPGEAALLRDELERRRHIAPRAVEGALANIPPAERSAA